MSVYVSYVPPCQGENKPILMKIGRVSAFYSHGLAGPCRWWWMLEVYDFLGRGCRFYRASAGLFRAFRKSRFRNARKKARRGERCACKEEKAETPLWRTNEVANCHRKPLSLLFQFANSKQPPRPLRGSWQKYRNCFWFDVYWYILIFGWSENSIDFSLCLDNY